MTAQSSTKPSPWWRKAKPDEGPLVSPEDESAAQNASAYGDAYRRQAEAQGAAAAAADEQGLRNTQAFVARNQLAADRGQTPRSEAFHPRADQLFTGEAAFRAARHSAGGAVTLRDVQAARAVGDNGPLKPPSLRELEPEWRAAYEARAKKSLRNIDEARKAAYNDTARVEKRKENEERWRRGNPFDYGTNYGIFGRRGGLVGPQDPNPRLTAGLDMNDRNASAQEYIAGRQADAREYIAEREAEAREHAANANLEGLKYQTDAQMEAAKADREQRGREFEATNELEGRRLTEAERAAKAAEAFRDKEFQETMRRALAAEGQLKTNSDREFQLQLQQMQQAISEKEAGEIATKAQEAFILHGGKGWAESFGMDNPAGAIFDGSGWWRRDEAGRLVKASEKEQAELSGRSAQLTSATRGLNAQYGTQDGHLDDSALRADLKMVGAGQKSLMIAPNGAVFIVGGSPDKAVKAALSANNLKFDDLTPIDPKAFPHLYQDIMVSLAG